MDALEDSHTAHTYIQYTKQKESRITKSMTMKVYCILCMIQSNYIRTLFDRTSLKTLKCAIKFTTQYGSSNNIMNCTVLYCTVLYCTVYRYIRAQRHITNSYSIFIQKICSTTTHDKGTMTRCGPLTPFFSKRYVQRAIVCMVFPRPISSAKIPLRLLL